MTVSSRRCAGVNVADLLVQASHQGVVVLVLLLLALIGPVALAEEIQPIRLIRSERSPL